MRDTKIVFIGIAVMAILPILFQGGKHIWSTFKGHNVKYLWIRLLATIAVSFAVILLVVSLYRFTLDYQAPLVAEKFHRVFSQRIAKNLSQEDYLDSLKMKDLVYSDFIFVENEEIERLNIAFGEYSVYLSENIYDNEDGTVTLYAHYQREDEEFYTALKLEMENNKWRAVEHKILTEEELNEAGLQKRFYKIEV